ncbi:hypothetical protein Syun_011131 [Stephania yunnanensis]|uniref:Uncharacterized protein n=1 Tax=Stephania yunnanensis TaxID=152371 RepID=A0AAP0PI73_9MAGN
MKSSVVAIVDDTFCFREETHLTVQKTSLFFPGDGFSVYNCQGKVVFRVDSYGPDARFKDELVLMDALGKCLLTVRRKRPSLHQRWEGFLGEKSEGQKALFSVRRSSIIGRSAVTVELYGNPGDEYFQIEGSFASRCCTVYNMAREAVAEIKRKVDASTHVVLGRDVFWLCVKGGFDSAFAMGLVLILDQINGDDLDDYHGDRNDNGILEDHHHNHDHVVEHASEEGS